MTNYRKILELNAQGISQRSIEASVRMRRSSKLDVLARFHDVDLARSHLILVIVVRDLRLSGFVVRILCRIRLRKHESSEKALDESRLQFAFGVSAHLEHRFDDLRQV